MNDEERYFTIREASKLLGVSTLRIKRRIKSKKIKARTRIGKHGSQVVIPEGSLGLEIMSFIPDSRALNLSDFEALVIKRFEAMALIGDTRVSRALTELRKEFVQLTTELSAFNGGPREDLAQSKVKNRPPSTSRGQERARPSLLQPAHPSLGSSKNE